MELRDKVVITEYDIRTIEDLFKAYNDPVKNNLVMTDELHKELEIFKTKNEFRDYTVEDQRRLTVALCHSLSNTTHELLRDPALQEVFTAVDTVWHDAEFYEELEKIIQDPQKAED